MHCKRAKTRVEKLLGGQSCEQIQRYNNLPPCMATKWLPLHIPGLNFLGNHALVLHLNRSCDDPDFTILILSLLLSLTEGRSQIRSREAYINNAKKVKGQWAKMIKRLL